MIRVELPQHLRTLARVGAEVQLDVAAPVTQRSVLDALEARYPMLRGTIRDHVTQKRRPFLRFFASGQDFSHEAPDAPLPEAIASGKEPFLIIGAIAGGNAPEKGGTTTRGVDREAHARLHRGHAPVGETETDEDPTAGVEGRLT